MKKFLKVFIVVVMVLGVIGGTCFFFFRNHKEKMNTTEPLIDYFNSKGSVEFKEEMFSMSEIVNSDGKDNRLNLIIETNNKMDSIVNVLISYYINSNTQINNEEISKALNNVKSSRSLLLDMMNEYEIKSTSIYFNRHLGANDFYIQASNYLIQYANLVKLINNNVSVDKNVDAKFNLFEIYSNIVIETFSYINYQESLTSKVVVSNVSSISILNNRLIIVNSIVQTTGGLFSKYINDFNKYYNMCDKTQFVSKLAENIGSVNSAEQNSNEKIATYYFKVIMGL